MTRVLYAAPLLVKKGDHVWVTVWSKKVESVVKQRGRVIDVREQHPGDRYPSILIEGTMSAWSAWFNVDKLTPVSVVDRLSAVVSKESSS